MGKIREPEPVNLIIGMLSSIPDVFDIVESKLESCYGAIDIRSKLIQFTFTNYYEQKMGGNISRKFIGFKNLIEPGDIATIKIHTNKLEEEITSSGSYDVSRAVNLDPGYICKSKLILATTKDYSHRIYLQKGILAEITLQYHSKISSYQHQSWTFPDYRTMEYIEFFNNVRKVYLIKLNSFNNSIGGLI